MQIALEATAACRPIKTGVARYAIQLMEALSAGNGATEAPDGLEYTAYYRLSRWPKKGYRRPAIRGIPARWYQEPFPPLGPRPDVVHGLEVRVPAWRNVRRVATIHDVFALISEDFTPERTRQTRAAGYAEMARRCHHIVADSECTRRDFLRYFDFPEERMHVVHLGVDSRFHPREEDEWRPHVRRFGLEAPYFLYVGDLTVRKNLVRLLQAYRRCSSSNELDLVVVGAREHGAHEIDAELSRPSGTGQIRLLGRVADEELPFLYAGASAFLFPTLYEGFGLPVLEALASGIPVLGSDVGAVPEIAGSHAVLVDPTDVEALAEGIDRTLALDGDAIERGRLHAARFTWQRCAEETKAVYRAL